MGKIALVTEVTRNRLVLYDLTHNIELCTWTADQDSISHCVTLEHAHDDFADLNSARIFARNNGSVGLTVELKNGKWGSATLYDDERLK